MALPNILGEKIEVTLVNSHTSKDESPSKATKLGTSLDFFHRYFIGTFALLFLLVGSSGIILFGRYDSARILALTKPIEQSKQLTKIISGPSITIPSSQLQTQIQSITSQQITLEVGTHNVSVSPTQIKSWLKVTASGNAVQDYIQIDTSAIESSVKSLAAQFAIAPINSVTVTHTDGITPSGVIVAGRDGSALGDLSVISTQSKQFANSILNGQGAQFSAPLTTVPAQAFTPANFSKMIEVDLVTKRMYTYENGQIAQTYLISAGKSDTPTPVGEFHIYAKYAVQDMRGFNPDGTPYLQPHVRWINYFYGGDAIHGNYWRPLSYFGNINSSHGCVGLPDDLAVGVYNWAPIGTTVITHD
ncbi:MAG: L,D-transpeptidase [Candidatus Saccharimonadales bacterium]